MQAFSPKDLRDSSFSQQKKRGVHVWYPTTQNRDDERVAQKSTVFVWGGCLSELQGMSVQMQELRSENKALRARNEEIEAKLQGAL